MSVSRRVRKIAVEPPQITVDGADTDIVRSKSRLSRVGFNIVQSISKNFDRFVGIEEREPESDITVTREGQTEEMQPVGPASRDVLIHNAIAQGVKQRMMSMQWKDRTAFFVTVQSKQRDEGDEESMFEDVGGEGVEDVLARQSARIQLQLKQKRDARAALKERQKLRKERGEHIPFERKPHKPIFTIFVWLVQTGLLAWSLVYGNGFVLPSINPFAGPSRETLIVFGAKYGPIMIVEGIYRVFTSLFIWNGVISWIFFGFGTVVIGKELEKGYGWRIIPIFIISGCGGNLLSLVFVPDHVSCGSSACIFGYFGVLVVDLMQSWSRMAKPWRDLGMFVGTTALALGMGILPLIDNFQHVGGLVFGILSGAVFLPNICFGVWTARFKTFLVLLCVPIIGFLLWLLWFIFSMGALALSWCPVCETLNCLPVFFYCYNL